MLVMTTSSPRSRPTRRAARPGSRTSPRARPWPTRAPVARVTEPGELVALTPYQLGFVPRSSLVALALREAGTGPSGRPTHATAGAGRVDLPATPDACREAATHLARALAAGDPDAVLVLVFGPDQRAQREPPAHPGTPLHPGETAVAAADALADLLEDDGIDVLDLLYVEDGRWTSLECLGLDCCPPEGRPVPLPQTVPAVAELVGRGAAPAADREVLARSTRAGTDPLAAEVAKALPRARAAQRRAPVTDRTVLRRWRDCLLRPAEAVSLDPRSAQPLPSAATVARLVAELESDDRAPGNAFGLEPATPPRSLRDAVLAWSCPDDLSLAMLPASVLLTAHEVLGPCREKDEAERAAIVDRLAAIVRCVPLEASAAASGLLAAVAWQNGDPVRARCAADQALAVDPRHRLAALVLRGLDLGIVPGRDGAGEG